MLVVAYPCLSLLIVAYRCVSVQLRCLALLIIACRCLSSLVAACRCLSLLVFAYCRTSLWWSEASRRVFFEPLVLYTLHCFIGRLQSWVFCSSQDITANVSLRYLGCIRQVVFEPYIWHPFESSCLPQIISRCFIMLRINIFTVEVSFWLLGFCFCCFCWARKTKTK